MKLHFTLLAIALGFIGCDSKKETSIATPEKRTTIEMTTHYGTMVIELYNETPKHRDNFVKLAKEKVFDSVVFHRVIEAFVVQGGNPATKPTPVDSTKLKALEYKVDAEFSPALFHKKGALGAARDGNLQRASSSTQFYFVQGKVYNDSLLNLAQNTINERLAAHYFKNDTVNKPIMDALQQAMDARNRELYFAINDSINKLSKDYTNFDSYEISADQWETYKSIGGTPTLDQNYTVFGEIVQGIEVMDSIASVPTNEQDRPLKDVRIYNLKVLK